MKQKRERSSLWMWLIHPEEMFDYTNMDFAHLKTLGAVNVFLGILGGLTTFPVHAQLGGIGTYIIH